MTTQEQTIRVTVDLTNPGEFFACCGLLELGHRLWPGAQGWFAAETFCIAGTGAISQLLNAIIERTPAAILTLDNGLSVRPIIAPLMLTLSNDGAPTLLLDVWIRVGLAKNQATVMGNVPWNFWSGQQTSLGIWRMLASAAREQLQQFSAEDLTRLFEFRVPLSGRFGFEPGAAWNARDVGFSPNAQGMNVASSPIVELLAAVGVQRFRPAMSPDRQSFKYAVWQQPLEAPVAASYAAGFCGQHLKHFRGRVVSRGQYAALGRSTPLTGDTNE
jgi:CRISPR-associated protein Csx14